MSRLPPNLRCQRSWLISATCGPPGTASARVNARPTAGETPSTSKSAGDTLAAGNRLSLGFGRLGDCVGPRPEGCQRLEAARVTLDVRVGAAAQRQLPYIAIVAAPGKPDDVDALRIPVWERS